MTIMAEAYEAHRIEQLERKEKYLKQFEQEISNKLSRWKMISSKHKEEISKEDLAFMILEIGYKFDSFFSESTPYLQGHTKRLRQKHVDSLGTKTFVDVLSVYFKGMAFILEKELGVFGRKKVIDSGIDKAKEVLKETEEKAHELQLFLQGELDYMESWEKDKRKWEIYDHQLMINRPFLPKDIEWIINESQISIEEQVDTGKLFFIHHFDRVKNEEHLKKRMENFSKVFTHYQKALETIATEPIPMLDTGGHLERMKNHLREAKQSCATEHHEVKRYLEEATKQTDEI